MNFKKCFSNKSSAVRFLNKIWVKYQEIPIYKTVSDGKIQTTALVLRWKSLLVAFVELELIQLNNVKLDVKLTSIKSY